MKKIAIVACLNANDVCAGVGCLNALDNRRAHFEAYKDEEVRLCAFMRCSHCGVDPQDDKGMMEKLERIAKCSVDAVHVGVCGLKKDGKPCPHMQKTVEWFEAQGVRVIWGTH